MKSLPPIFLIAVLALGGCASPNVRSASTYNGPAAPRIQNFFYDPNAAYASANATWQPPVYNRQGTIVKPVEPSSQANRPDYEHAQWATGAAGGDADRPPGTF